ncbi:MAG TPA: response regulator [Steroidobacteraceae bacterium]|jgi:signal transduction histidine kinase/DNA-binding response OmpR family regulator/CHASE3 domain sensor protein|nr:response regulator [Steroidobacteraceae bacterium]
MDSSPDIHQTLDGVLTGPRLPGRTLLGFLIAMTAVVVIALLSYQSLQASNAAAGSLTRSIQVLGQLEGSLSTLKDAETGQRGYLLTGEDAYLAPYLDAKATLPAEFKALHELTAGRTEQARRLDIVEGLAHQKMDELENTVALRRAGKIDAALALVRTDRGKTLMDQLRVDIGQLEENERQLVVQRSQAWRDSARISLAVTLGGSGVLLVLIGASAVIASRDHRARQLQSWMRTAQMSLSETMLGDQTLEKLSNNVLGYLAPLVGAQVGALYVAEGGAFRRHAAYALPAGSGVESMRGGDGLIGQAVKDRRSLRVRDVPPGYLPIGSALGRGTPGELLISPAVVDGLVQAVVELGFFGAINAAKAEFLDRASESIAVAVRTSKDRQRLEELLQETQQQSEELQTSSEELRVSNEELEEQGRALRESQAQLESQQAELEQINSQLEEQTQLLERQKDALARSHEVLAAKTVELRRSNEYKSEFLANMSHELRTPLNSTLILAKLLSDNKEGNLTPTQVKFAQTITSAGNDLLHLINDVLDLARIEAGKVSIAVESVSVARAIEEMVKMFQPMAEQKRLRFAVSVDPAVPAQIETDAQRLGQILKNLLSNAVKFTEAGEVALRVYCPRPQAVSFAVRDTGVGILPHQQEVIFEAFRQADGSIHRKFGGTGLGLSISRDLAELLGGGISVQSQPGEGSLFTLTLPVAYSGAPVAAAAGVPAAATSAINAPVPLAEGAAAPAADALSPPAAEDDRDSATPGGRTILVVEDDMAFAVILRDLAREMGFKCVLTHRANDGVIAAARFLPSAVLLDVNLPDHSGLGVLDQLKHDSRTRHIPVHVISVTDYKREVLELGAIGFVLKPAQREQLMEALKRMEAKFAQNVRHVLVVEDDPRQRESICQLLASDDVRLTAVPSAGDALEELKKTTFDCMVMDLNLPDLSGYDLLEKMSRQEDVAFPPVIVYTGRSLTRDEEQRLRRFSKSIIIKDARSPERLLDEVTLFLHQVEAKLPLARQQMLRAVRDREAGLDGRRILIVEDDVRNIFALSSVLEPKGVQLSIARNGREALDALGAALPPPGKGIDLVLMDIMMPVMDGLTAMREIRKRPEWRSLPIIALTAKAMKDDQEKCLTAGANDYIAKPLDVEKLLSLVRVWMPK